jgi:hypothetical protein
MSALALIISSPCRHGWDFYGPHPI